MFVPHLDTTLPIAVVANSQVMIDCFVPLLRSMKQAHDMGLGWYENIEQ